MVRDWTDRIAIVRHPVSPGLSRVTMSRVSTPTPRDKKTRDKNTERDRATKIHDTLSAKEMNWTGRGP